MRGDKKMSLREEEARKVIDELDLIVPVPGVEPDDLYRARRSL